MNKHQDREHFSQQAHSLQPARDFKDRDENNGSHKHQQLTSTLSRVLQELITRGLNDPRVVGIITVTGCDISPDHKQATIRISVMPEKYQTRVAAGLNHAAGHLRREALDKIHVRFLPNLTFTVDTSLKKQAAVIDALLKVSAEREAKAASSPAANAEPAPAAKQRRKTGKRAAPASGTAAGARKAAARRSAARRAPDSKGPAA